MKGNEWRSDMITKPMLAGKVKDLDKIDYPVYATPKLDGIRAVMIDGKLVSRNFKAIPNNFTRTKFEKILPDNTEEKRSMNTCYVN